MAISEIGTASTGGTSTSNIALTHGLTIASGDVLVAFIHNDVYNVTQTDNNGSTPFTSVHNFVVPTDQSAGYVWERVAGASEPSTYNWTMSAAPSFSIVLRQFRGVDTASIWDVAPSGSTTATGQSNSATAPDITVTEGAMGLVAVYVDSSSLTCSNPSNSYGTEVEVGNRQLATYIRGSLSAGAVGSVSVQIGLPSVDDWAAIHCALKPAAEEAVFTGLTVTRPLG